MPTQHYERRDDGFYVTWAGDFAGDRVGQRKIYDGGDLRMLSTLNPATQRTYMDLRARRRGKFEVNEMGRCKRCDDYVPALSETSAAHLCVDLRARYCWSEGIKLVNAYERVIAAEFDRQEAFGMSPSAKDIAIAIVEGRSSAAERRSPEPGDAGSSPAGPANDLKYTQEELKFVKVFHSLIHRLTADNEDTCTRCGRDYYDFVHWGHGGHSPSRGGTAHHLFATPEPG